MAKLKTLDFIADHVATSHVEEMQEQIVEMLFAEGIIEETDDASNETINYVLKEVGHKLVENYTDETDEDEDEEEDFQSERLRESGISYDEYENGDPYDEGDREWC